MPAMQHPTSSDVGGRTDEQAGRRVSSRDLDGALAAEFPDLSSDGQFRLRVFRDLLLEWNERFNLTAIREPDAVDRVLLLDALRMLPALDAAASESGLRQPSLIDIGSGGGLPAIPLAICRPTLDVTMVEATGKKVGFLREVIDTIDLGNARAIHARAEELARSNDERERYDLASARAVASLPALVELVAPFLRVGGIALFPKGLAIAGELPAARFACREVGCELVGAVPLAGGETMLVTIRKTSETPNRYPRRPGLPARQPLGFAPGVRS